MVCYLIKQRENLPLIRDEIKKYSELYMFTSLPETECVIVWVWELWLSRTYLCHITSVKFTITIIRRPVFSHCIYNCILLHLMEVSLGVKWALIYVKVCYALENLRYSSVCCKGFCFWGCVLYHSKYCMNSILFYCFTADLLLLQEVCPTVGYYFTTDLHVHLKVKLKSPNVAGNL